jgi:hypothetical protein
MRSTGLWPVPRIGSQRFAQHPLNIHGRDARDTTKHTVVLYFSCKTMWPSKPFMGGSLRYCSHNSR